MREIRTLRSMWRGLETWLGWSASTIAGAPVPDPTTDEAIADWRAEPRTTPGGQPCYSPLAILTGLTSRTLFHLALDRVYASVAQRHPETAVVVPPRTTAVPSDTAETATTQRDGHLQRVAEHGRMARQSASGYNRRARRAHA